MKNLILRKYGISLTLALIVIMSLAYSSHAQSNSKSIIAAEGIELTVDFGNGTIREYLSLNGSTVLEVTSSVLEVEVQWFASLAYIRSIEGKVGEGEYGWQYWVNDEFASAAVNLYTLEDGDTVSWVFSSPVPGTQQDPTFIPGAVITAASGFGFIAIVYIQTRRRIR